MSPPTQFVTAPDGARLAWSELGSGDPLVLERGWITHVELTWEDVAFRSFIEALATGVRVIRFDHRGMGLSDRDVAVPDLDTLVLDLEAVMDGCELEQVALWGSCFGGPAAVRYAARHPDRVSRLVLDGTWVRPDDLRAGDDSDGLRAQMIELLRVSPEPVMAFSSYMTDPAPTSRHEERVERMRKSIAPDMLADLNWGIVAMDVEDEARSLELPTLVLHRRESRVVPLAAGRRLASTISGARFVGLDGASHNVWEGDADAALSAIGDFLGVSAQMVAADEPSGVMVLLMTDVVESTATTERLGDEAARPLQIFHDDTVRGALRDHGGVEVSHTGDGIFARFSSAAAAAHCARQVQERFARRNADASEPLHVRIGIHAGEPVAGAGDVFGAAVQKTARVCAAAHAGEVVVTPVIRALVEGKRLAFADRGEHELKGFAEPVRLYALT